MRLLGPCKRASNNPADRTYNVWNGLWDSTGVSAGEHKIDVLVKCSEKPAPISDTITVDLDLITLPNGQEAFSYPPSVSPNVNTDPSVANPVGVGSVATGGNILSLRVFLPEFSVPVDIYGTFISSNNPTTVNIFEDRPDLQRRFRLKKSIKRFQQEFSPQEWRRGELMQQDR